MEKKFERTGIQVLIGDETSQFTAFCFNTHLKMNIILVILFHFLLVLLFFKMTSTWIAMIVSSVTKHKEDMIHRI